MASKHKEVEVLRPQALVVAKAQGVIKSELDEDYTTRRRDPRYDNAFNDLLGSLRARVYAAKDHILWQDENIFVTIVEDDMNRPTLREGALVWVDTSQKPKPTGGIVEGDMYYRRFIVKTKTKPMTVISIARACIWYRNGIWGREYFRDSERNRDHAREELLRYHVEFKEQQDHINDNLRFVGRVIGTLNPI